MYIERTEYVDSTAQSVGFRLQLEYAINCVYSACPVLDLEFLF